MKHGYTRTEAEALRGQVFETRSSLGRVPPRTRGRVIEALDAGDHWNVLMEWELPPLPLRMWYDKFDVQGSMRPLLISAGTSAAEDERQILEIQSSHDLAARSEDARRTGAHSYQVDCREFASMLAAWEKDKAKRVGLLGLTTLRLERIWITSRETRLVAAAIQATRPRVRLD
jgi:hypothetical protein